MSGLHYISTGMGNRRFVFIHGFGGASQLWKYQYEFLAMHGKVYAIDLPGHGKSAWNGETFEEFTRSVRKVLEKENITQADFIVSSFGGFIVWDLFEKDPSLIRSAVFTCSTPTLVEREGFPAGLNAPKVRKLMGQFQGGLGPVLDMFFRSLFTIKEREDILFPRIKEIRKDTPLPQRDALLSVLQMIEELDLRGAAARFTPASLFIMGDSDYICPVSIVEPLKGLVPKAIVKVFNNCGHFPFLTKPAIFNHELKEFLSL